MISSSNSSIDNESSNDSKAVMHKQLPPSGAIPQKQVMTVK